MSDEKMTEQTNQQDTQLTNAYIFLVMKDEKYALGAMTAAFSLRLTKPKYPIVCMVTNDIKNILPQLKKVFDVVVVVPYLETVTNSLRTHKQNTMYANWKDISFTKWNCLNLDYNKVLFLDADKIILENMDHLFELNTPAGTFSSPHSEVYLGNGTSGIKDPYYPIKHGEYVTDQMINIGLFGERGKSSFTVIGTSILLSPNKRHYDSLVTMLSKYSHSKPFGLSCYSMTDEQSIVFFYKEYLPKTLNQHFKWTYISQKYNWISWRYKWLRKTKNYNEFPPSLIHYFGIKPWILERNDWLDLEVWWTIVKHMIITVFNNDKDIQELYRPEQLLKIEQPGCFYCKIANISDWNNHQFINKECSIVCPLYIKQKSD